MRKGLTFSFSLRALQGGTFRSQQTHGNTTPDLILKVSAPGEPAVRL